MSERTGELSSRSVLLVLSVLAVLVVLNVPELGADTRMFRPETIEPSGPLAWLVRLADRSGILAYRARWRWQPASSSPSRGSSRSSSGHGSTGHWLRSSRSSSASCSCPRCCYSSACASRAPRGSSRTTPPTRSSWRGERVLDGDNPYGHHYGYWPRAFLQLRRHDLRGDANGASGPTPSGLLPRHAAVGRPFARAPGSFRRLPAARPARHAVHGCRGARIPRTGCRRPRSRCGTRSEPAGGTRRLVRGGGRPEPRLLAARLCPRLALTGGRSGGLPRHRHPPQAVRPRRATVPRRAAPRRGDAPRGPLSCGRRIRGVLSPDSCHSWSDAGALWRDTIAYGADTYRIIGYGLAGILVEVGVIEERTDPYPFAYLAAFVWLPLTAWLVWIQLRARTLWIGAVAFSSRCSSCSIWDECSRTPTSSGLSPGLAWPTCWRRRGLPPRRERSPLAESHGERRRTRSDVPATSRPATVSS